MTKQKIEEYIKKEEAVVKYYLKQENEAGEKVGEARDRIEAFQIVLRKMEEEV